MCLAAAVRPGCVYRYLPTVKTLTICVSNVCEQPKPIYILFASFKVLRASGLQIYKHPKVCVCPYATPMHAFCASAPTAQVSSTLHACEPLLLVTPQSMLALGLWAVPVGGSSLLGPGGPCATFPRVTRHVMTLHHASPFPSAFQEH